MYDTNVAIEKLIEHIVPSGELQSEHMLRECLRSLVRLAQSEYRSEVRDSLKKLTNRVP